MFIKRYFIISVHRGFSTASHYMFSFLLFHLYFNVLNMQGKGLQNFTNLVMLGAAKKRLLELIQEPWAWRSSPMLGKSTQEELP